MWSAAAHRGDTKAQNDLDREQVRTRAGSRNANAELRKCPVQGSQPPRVSQVRSDCCCSTVGREMVRRANPRKLKGGAPRATARSAQVERAGRAEPTRVALRGTNGSAQKCTAGALKRDCYRPGRPMPQEMRKSRARSRKVGTPRPSQEGPFRNTTQGCPGVSESVLGTTQITDTENELVRELVCTHPVGSESPGPSHDHKSFTNRMLCPRNPITLILLMRVKSDLASVIMIIKHICMNPNLKEEEKKIHESHDRNHLARKEYGDTPMHMRAIKRNSRPGAGAERIAIGTVTSRTIAAPNTTVRNDNTEPGSDGVGASIPGGDHTPQLQEEPRQRGRPLTDPKREPEHERNSLSRRWILSDPQEPAMTRVRRHQHVKAPGIIDINDMQKYERKWTCHWEDKIKKMRLHLITRKNKEELTWENPNQTQ